MARTKIKVGNEFKSSYQIPVGKVVDSIQGLAFNGVQTDIIDDAMATGAFKVLDNCDIHTNEGQISPRPGYYLERVFTLDTDKPENFQDVLISENIFYWIINNEIFKDGTNLTNNLTFNGVFPYYEPQTTGLSQQTFIKEFNYNNNTFNTQGKIKGLKYKDKIIFPLGLFTTTSFNIDIKQKYNNIAFPLKLYLGNDNKEKHIEFPIPYKPTFDEFRIIGANSLVYSDWDINKAILPYTIENYKKDVNQYNDVMRKLSYYDNQVNLVQSGYDNPITVAVVPSASIKIPLTKITKNNTFINTINTKAIVNSKIFNGIENDSSFSNINNGFIASNISFDKNNFLFPTVLYFNIYYTDKDKKLHFVKEFQMDLSFKKVLELKLIDPDTKTSTNFTLDTFFNDDSLFNKLENFIKKHYNDLTLSAPNIELPLILKMKEYNVGNTEELTKEIVDNNDYNINAFISTFSQNGETGWSYYVPSTIFNIPFITIRSYLQNSTETKINFKLQNSELNLNIFSGITYVYSSFTQTLNNTQQLWLNNFNLETIITGKYEDNILQSNNSLSYLKAHISQPLVGTETLNLSYKGLDINLKADGSVNPTRNTALQWYYYPWELNKNPWENQSLWTDKPAPTVATLTPILKPQQPDFAKWIKIEASDPLASMPFGTMSKIWSSYESILIGCELPNQVIPAKNEANVTPVTPVYWTEFVINDSKTGFWIDSEEITSCKKTFIENGCLFLYDGKVNNRIYFSEPENLYYFPNDNYLDLPINPKDEILTVVTVRKLKVFFTKEKLLVLVGQNKTNWDIETFHDATGTIDGDSVVAWGNYVFFATNTGFFQLNPSSFNTGLSSIKYIDEPVKHGLTLPLLTEVIKGNDTCIGVKNHSVIKWYFPNQKKAIVYYPNEDKWNTESSEIFEGLKKVFFENGIVNLIRYNKDKKQYEHYTETEHADNQYYDGDVNNQYPYTVTVESKWYNVEYPGHMKKYKNIQFKFEVPNLYNHKIDNIDPTKWVNMNIKTQIFIDNNEITKSREKTVQHNEDGSVEMIDKDWEMDLNPGAIAGTPDNYYAGTWGLSQSGDTYYLLNSYNCKNRKGYGIKFIMTASKFGYFGLNTLLIVSKLKKAKPSKYLNQTN